MTMRSVQDRFWSDGWVRKLNPLDRYLFLYLLTNEHTNWCGAYELEIGMMSYESGIDERDLERSMLPRLAPKIIYVDGWVYIPNWVKHHHAESGNMSPQQKKGVAEAWNKVPENIRLRIKEIEGSDIPYAYPMERVSASSLSISLSSSLSSASSVVEVSDEEVSKSSKKKGGDLGGFPAFWEVYPRREDKVSASAAWRTLSQEKRALATADVKTRAQSPAWKKENGKYIPLARTYLSNHRWEDEGVVVSEITNSKYEKYD